MTKVLGGGTLSVADWVARASAALMEKGVPEPRANAEFLMAAVLKAGRADVLLQRARSLPQGQGRRFWSLVAERAKRVPLSYVLGSQPFMRHVLSVTPDVLIPRPETEETVAAAVELLKARGRPALHLLELGTGSGCIAVALSAAFPEATVYATDISRAALRLALKNAEANHVSARIRFICEDLFKPGAERRGWADLLISNPPYIPTRELGRLPQEVRREPVMALDGGPDGLVALRAIIAAAPGLLKPDGLLVLEMGAGQGPAVLKLMAAAGLRGSLRKDAQGHDRIAVGERPK